MPAPREQLLADINRLLLELEQSHTEVAKLYSDGFALFCVLILQFGVYSEREIHSTTQLRQLNIDRYQFNTKCHDSAIDSFRQIIIKMSKVLLPVVDTSTLTDKDIFVISEANDRLLYHTQGNDKKAPLEFLNILGDIYETISKCMSPSVPFNTGLTITDSHRMTESFTNAIMDINKHCYRLFLSDNFATYYRERRAALNTCQSLLIALRNYTAFRGISNSLLQSLGPIYRQQTSFLKSAQQLSLLPNEQLEKFKTTLVKNKKKLQPYVNIQKKTHKLNYIIPLILLVYIGVVAERNTDMVTESVNNLPFHSMTSMLFTLYFGLGYINSKRESYLAHRNMTKIQKDLSSIFSEVMPKLEITSFVQNNRATSCIRVKAIQAQGVTRSNRIIDMIKLTLHHFNISLHLDYTRSYFYLSGYTYISDPKKVNEFFLKLLERAKKIEILDKQIDTLLLELRKKISHQSEKILTINQDDLYDRQLIINISNSDALMLLAQYGFEKSNTDWILTSNTPLTNFDALIAKIKKLDLNPNTTSTISHPSSSSITKHLRLLPPVHPVKDHKQESVAQEEEKVIAWPSGVTFPGQAQPVANAYNTYLYWNLNRENFGNDQVAYDAFQNKSLQLARAAKDEQGIKYGSYYGTDCHTKQQRFFPARIKVLGIQNGDNAVLLDFEQVNENRLLKTCGFARGIHS